MDWNKSPFHRQSDIAPIHVDADGWEDQLRADLDQMRSDTAKVSWTQDAR